MMCCTRDKFTPYHVMTGECIMADKCNILTSVICFWIHYVCTQLSIEMLGHKH